MNNIIEIPEPKLSRFLFADTRMSWVWLVVRVYVGYEWLMAGWGKTHNPMWIGPQAGTAIKGFFAGALAKMGGPHPDVSSWYGWFLQNFAMPNAVWFSYIISYGELLVGIALILGALTGIAAFFGMFMNMNFLLAGTISVNPVLFLLGLFLVLAWRNAGWVGLDRFALPLLGTPWQPGKIWKKPESQ